MGKLPTKTQLFNFISEAMGDDITLSLSTMAKAEDETSWLVEFEDNFLTKPIVYKYTIIFYTQRVGILAERAELIDNKWVFTDIKMENSAPKLKALAERFSQKHHNREVF